jgi:hypothetical protein
MESVSKELAYVVEAYLVAKEALSQISEDEDSSVNGLISVAQQALEQIGSIEYRQAPRTERKWNDLIPSVGDVVRYEYLAPVDGNINLSPSRFLITEVKIFRGDGGYEYKVYGHKEGKALDIDNPTFITVLHRGGNTRMVLA